MCIRDSGYIVADKNSGVHIARALDASKALLNVLGNPRHINIMQRNQTVLDICALPNGSSGPNQDTQPAGLHLQPHGNLLFGCLKIVSKGNLVFGDSQLNQPFFQSIVNAESGLVGGGNVTEDDLCTAQRLILLVQLKDAICTTPHLSVPALRERRVYRDVYKRQ